MTYVHMRTAAMQNGDNRLHQKLQYLISSDAKILELTRKLYIFNIYSRFYTVHSTPDLAIGLAGWLVYGF
jgi:hypothetical protein